MSRCWMHRGPGHAGWRVVMYGRWWTSNIMMHVLTRDVKSCDYGSFSCGDRPMWDYRTLQDGPFHGSSSRPASTHTCVCLNTNNLCYWRVAWGMAATVTCVDCMQPHAVLLITVMSLTHRVLGRPTNARFWHMKTCLHRINPSGDRQC